MKVDHSCSDAPLRQQFLRLQGQVEPVGVTDDGEVIAVLDIDSPIPDRFDLEDKAGCEALGKILEKVL